MWLVYKREDGATLLENSIHPYPNSLAVKNIILKNFKLLQVPNDPKTATVLPAHIRDLGRVLVRSELWDLNL